MKVYTDQFIPQSSSLISTDKAMMMDTTRPKHDKQL
jgi:hypothetical protein